MIPTVDFDEIGGQNRVKNELKEALQFLIDRKKIAQFGIRPIKGILLTGPPGTGKTLMAKAAAHYTDSVFVSASGSEFVEMYVGVGAKRVRSLFENARLKAKKNKSHPPLSLLTKLMSSAGNGMAANSVNMTKRSISYLRKWTGSGPIRMCSS